MAMQCRKRCVPKAWSAPKRLVLHQRILLSIPTWPSCCLQPRAESFGRRDVFVAEDAAQHLVVARVRLKEAQGGEMPHGMGK